LFWRKFSLCLTGKKCCIEDVLKRLARKKQLDDENKASELKESLKKSLET
jgi:hypothetical protein